jgi:predicted small metal-binding protein
VTEFNCDVVFPSCSTHFEAETEEQILQQVAVHVREAHGMDEVPPELVDQVRAGMADAPAA